MEIIIKTFDELTNDELLEIFRLRIDVFVVEQQCAYHEIDDYEKGAVHLMLKEQGEILAYLRVLPKNTKFEDVSIGRVITAKSARRKGCGSILLAKGIEVAAERFNAEHISLAAQTYARPFYEKLGFRQVSEVFLEDDIPHINMRLTV